MKTRLSGTFHFLTYFITLFEQRNFHKMIHNISLVILTTFLVITPNPCLFEELSQLVKLNVK